MKIFYGVKVQSENHKERSGLSKSGQVDFE